METQPADNLQTAGAPSGAGNGAPGPERPEPHSLRRNFLAFLHDRFNLSGLDNASQKEVMENVRKGVEFRGANLWVLIFAILVASIGLNVNSTAVIIGAMLISPLMGPIMGVGLSVGINDFDLMKQSLKSVGLSVAIGLITSTLYFVASPLSVAQSELLARTSPNIWDVLIAFFGGMAGIVAQTRRTPAPTVISGVAIATALMPPLCTAGFGLATLQFKYFFGAFYLLFINTVFISLATFILVRFLKYEKKQFIDPKRDRTVRRYIMAIVLVTIIPSVFLGYRIVKKSIFQSNAQNYVSKVLHFDHTQVVDYKAVYQPDSSRIEVVLIGRPLSDDVIRTVERQLANYKLSDTRLVIRQSDGMLDREALASMNSINKLYSISSGLLEEKDRQIAALEAEVARYGRDTLPAVEIARELSALADQSLDAALSKATLYRYDGRVQDTMLICILKRPGGALKLSAQETRKITNWLRTRTGCGNVKLILE